MKILITGAAGAVGSTLVKGMGQRHQLRGFDREEMPDLADSQVGDVADYEALLAAAEGMEAIIHLTGVDGEWEKALPNNFIGTYNMLEAARIQGVRRVAYASRAGVHGSLPEDVMRHINMRSPASGPLYGQQAIRRTHGLFLLREAWLGVRRSTHRQFQHQSRSARAPAPAQPRRCRAGL